jgi:hypothetical protein
MRHRTFASGHLDPKQTKDVLPNLPDVLGLLPDRIPHDRAKVWPVHVPVEVLRPFQSLVHALDALDKLLERVPGMKARRPWVGVDAPLRQRRHLRSVHKLLGEKREVWGRRLLP